MEDSAVALSPERRPRVPWVACGVAIALAVAGIVFELQATTRPSATFGPRGVAIPLALVLAIVGATLATKRPENPIGWILVFASLFAGLQAISEGYANWAFLTTGDRSTPARLAAAAEDWVWLPALSALASVCALFPDGKLISARWRAPFITGVVGVCIATLAGILSKQQTTYLGAHNPLGIPGMFAIQSVAFASVPLMLVIGASSVIVRFRRSHGDERAQMKWLAVSGSLIAAAFLMYFGEYMWLLIGGGSAAVSGTEPSGLVHVLPEAVMVLGLYAIPLSVGLAVLKYRLYDIDIVISKTVLFGSLAAFISAVYVGIVIGVGALLGQTDQANIGLAIVATAVVAVGFQPVRERMTRVANGLVYGERATPYQVLSEFAGRVGTTYAAEDVLPRTARVIAEGTGAERADVWLRVGNELRLSASWPPGADDGPGLELPGDGVSLPEIRGVDRAVPVLLQGSLLGAVTVTKAQGDPLRHAEEVLLDDLAGQAGLVLANARLTAELQARLKELTERSAELQRSRQRIVTAQDEERRRLERNIHDGAQQHLVALAVKLRLVRSLISRDPVKAGAMLAELRGEVDDALETLSNLALGIYPPLLEEQGLATALAAQYQRMDLTVRLHANGVSRYPIELEAAVYFCALEALQNIAKYANAGAVDITLGEREGDLTFEVTDDGQGFDAATAPRGSGLNNMRDRLSVLGGGVTVTSSQGRGTTVRGRVPLESERTIAGIS
ncbi:MAG: hypothetical protein QOG88_1260 [Actinomycetota bacterium]|nr:hypothetical protein [Actinomycetota bacterium]